MAAHYYSVGFGPSLQPPPHITLSRLPLLLAMDTESQRPKERGGVLSSLNVAIDATNLAKEISSIAPAKAVFGTVSVLLTMVRVRLLPVIGCSKLTRSQDSMANELDYVELGLSCAKICGALDRGLGGRRLEELSQSVCDAINQLTMCVCVCVWFYYTPNQLGGQRSPLFYDNKGIYVSSTQLNYSPKRNLKPQMRYPKARRK